MKNILELSIHEMVQYLNEERELNGLSVKEICKINNVSYGTVEKRYNKEYIYNKATKRLELRDNIRGKIEEFQYQYEGLLQEEIQELREIIDQLRQVPDKVSVMDEESVADISKKIAEEQMKIVIEQFNKQNQETADKLNFAKLKKQLSGNSEFYSTKIDTNIKKRWIDFTSLQRATVQELTELALHEFMDNNGY